MKFHKMFWGKIIVSSSKKFRNILWESVGWLTANKVSNAANFTFERWKKKKVVETLTKVTKMQKTQPHKQGNTITSEWSKIKVYVK